MIDRFSKNPPYAYVIPRKQRDPNTAAVLVEKLLIDGIEVHRAARSFQANDSTYSEGDWVVLMDQPFAALVKELFDLQKYPELPHPPPVSNTTGPGGGGGGGGRGAAAAPVAAATPAASGGGGGGRGAGRGAAGGGQQAAGSAPPTGQMPYDVTGWTLPLQMGVEVVTVAEPLSAESRAALQKIEQVEPLKGKVEGAGPVFAFSHNTNASLLAVNDLLAAGHKVSFSKDGASIYASGNAAAILEKDGVDAASMKDAPAAFAVAKPRIALYEPWAGNIDEGWTRWILEQFRFPFTIVHNADIQDGHLREHYDTIVFAEMPARQIMDGMAPGSVPGQYAGGIGETGAQALRDFVGAGGTVVALGNATLFAIEQFSLPVTNVVGSLPQSQFFCSGSMLRAEIKDPSHPVVAGLPEQPALMFERNPVFDTKPGFRGKVLASYVSDRNPLLSGFLLGAPRIQGKAAAIDADYGKGHIILLGFRPQWRGQSHGTYKFLFNALYYNPSMAPEAPARAAGGRGGRGGGGGGRAGRLASRSGSRSRRADQAARSEPGLLRGARSGGRRGGPQARNRARCFPARPPSAA